MRICLFSLLMAASSLSLAQQSIPQNERVNTMECSEQEVLAYVVPKEDDRLSPDYETYKAAHASTAVYSVAAENVETCLGVLYGDMGELSEQLGGAVDGMMSNLSTQEALSRLANEAFAKLRGSVCGSLNSGIEAAHTLVVNSVRTLHEELLDEVDDLVGERALAEYTDDYLVDQDPMGLGLRYRQSAISTQNIDRQLNSTMKSRWKKQLRELNRELPR